VTRNIDLDQYYTTVDAIPNFV